MSSDFDELLIYMKSYFSAKYMFPEVREQFLNEELHKLDSYKGIKCERCGQRYPDTILNIEAVIHHNAKDYECVDRKKCKRKEKK